MSRTDTIVAPATPPGRGGIAIVRVSGPKAPEIAAVVIGADLPPPRQAVLARFLGDDGEPLDVGFALFFSAPHSYTGEHVVEFHGHGGPVVTEALVARAIALGARRAHPGEFTQRAFLHGKVDLAQAEAVADLIDAGSTAAARAAMRSLQGEFSDMVRGLAEEVTELRASVEAAIDFPDDHVDAIADQELEQRLTALRDHFSAVERSARQGRLLREGMTVVIAGRPNAGKSSLLNRLAGYDAAIVTPIPGTTRDIVRERIDIDGMPLHILDTAGLRDAPDIVEAEGIRRATAEMARADRVLFIVDVSTDPDAQAYAEERARLPPDVPVTVILNKCDLAAGIPLTDTMTGPVRIAISALTGQGLEALRAHLRECVGYQVADAGTVSARARHLSALTRAREYVEAAADQLAARRANELTAEELRLAQQALGEITGEVSSDDLLGRVFSSFCIGK
jgi:tRNA modification GTPase